MNYYNIFIIIYIIDILIYIVEGLVFFIYARDKTSKAYQQILLGKLENLGKNYYPNLSKLNTEKQNDMFVKAVEDEKIYIMSNQRNAILFFVLSIIGLFALVGLYLWIVIVKLHQHIDFKLSIYIVAFVLFFILIYEIVLITTVFNNYMNNPLDLLLYINNKLLYYLK
jgi:hypothetical protein